jgi:hypothetical protein
LAALNANSQSRKVLLVDGDGQGREQGRGNPKVKQGRHSLKIEN